MIRWLIVLSWLCAVRLEGAEKGLASWYGEDHRGKLTASGKPFNPDGMTCASWYHPLGTTLKVSHGSRSIIVVVTDRGPNKRFKTRIIDLSRAAFARLESPEAGLIPVRTQVIQPTKPRN